jgi:hypothetical protein
LPLGLVWQRHPKIPRSDDLVVSRRPNMMSSFRVARFHPYANATHIVADSKLI